MYCVTCGTPLCDKNGEGLICRTCKQGQRKEKNRNKAPPGLEVKYCFVCGDLYCPNDASIRHLYHMYGLTEREETTSKSSRKGTQETYGIVPVSSSQQNSPGERVDAGENCATTVDQAMVNLRS